MLNNEDFNAVQDQEYTAICDDGVLIEVKSSYATGSLQTDYVHHPISKGDLLQCRGYQFAGAGSDEYPTLHFFVHGRYGRVLVPKNISMLDYLVTVNQNVQINKNIHLRQHIFLDKTPPNVTQPEALFYEPSRNQLQAALPNGQTVPVERFALISRDAPKGIPCPACS